MPAEFTDTLTNAAGEDSIATRSGTRFLPDDILLTWFNENYAAQYLRKYQRTEPRFLEFEFATKADSFLLFDCSTATARENCPTAGQ